MIFRFLAPERTAFRPPANADRARGFFILIFTNLNHIPPRRWGYVLTDILSLTNKI